MTQGQNEAKPRPLESTPLLALPVAVSFTHVAQLDLLPQTKGSPCPFQAPGSILEIPTEPFFIMVLDFLPPLRPLCSFINSLGISLIEAVPLVEN